MRVDWYDAQGPAEVVSELLRGLVAAGWSFLQAFEADGFQTVRTTRIESARRERLFVHDLLKHRGDIVSDERRAACQRVVENGAEGINVAGEADFGFGKRTRLACCGGRL